MSLEVSSLYFSYAKNSRLILDDVSFSVGEGDLLAVLGPNGVGKSTMFRCILGFLRNYQGSIHLNGRDIRTLDHKEIAKHIAYIPQSTYPVFNYTVLDVVLMGLTNQVNLLASPNQQHTSMRRMRRWKVSALRILGMRGTGRSAAASGSLR
jgi:iron complex transport system ATP-binding protein